MVQRQLRWRLLSGAFREVCKSLARHSLISALALSEEELVTTAAWQQTRRHAARPQSDTFSIHLEYIIAFI